MNKKILSLILLGAIIILPTIVLAEGSSTTLSQIAGQVRTTVTTVGGSIVFIGWVVTGIMYLTAAGAPEKLGTAKKALVACVIGTVLIILAGASGPLMEVIQDAFGLSGTSGE